jgi:NADH dehydrogenase
VRVLLIEAADHLLPGMPADLAEHTVEVLRKRGVEVCLNSSVESFDGQVVQLKGGETIATRTVIWAAGVKASALLQSLGVPLARQGRVPVEDTLQLAGHPEVFVIGDAAYREEDGAPLPMVAPVAMQQAETAARNVERLLQGEALVPFDYHDPGTLATIGRNQAVARVGRFKFSGFVAWVVWLVVHLIQLIGFRNRLFVLINWAWDYLLYDRPMRLIVPQERK